MRLVIDLQGAQSASRFRGIGRYSLALAENIAKLRGEHEVLIALSDAFPETIAPLRKQFSNILPAENVRVWCAPGPVAAHNPENTRRRRQAELIFEAFIASLKPDVLLITSLFEGYGDDLTVNVRAMEFDIPTAVILYDLIPLHNPEKYLLPNPQWCALYQERLAALERADMLLAISEYSAQDAATRLSLDTQRIVNISAACSDIFAPSKMTEREIEKLRMDLGISRDMIITAGTLDANKNLITFFKAFHNLPERVRSGHQIVIAGHANDAQRAAFAELARQAGLGADELIVTGYIPDDDLIALYTNAKLMVFPSLDEGFGLPPLEAMNCGTPTIASKAASIPEVIALPEAMFDPRDVSALASKMQLGLEDHEFRKELRANAARQSERFSWERTAETALHALLQLAEQRPRKTSEEALSLLLRELAPTIDETTDQPALFRALAFDFPATERPRHLFVDITHARTENPQLPRQATAQKILEAFLAQPPLETKVVPVYLVPERLGYLVATEFLSRAEQKRYRETPVPIDYAPGDVCIVMDNISGSQTERHSTLNQMHRKGVRVVFAVHDVNPLVVPQYFTEAERCTFEIQLRQTAGFDGMICFSRSVHSTLCHWVVQLESPPGLTISSIKSVRLGSDINLLPSPEGQTPALRPVIEKLTKSFGFLTTGVLDHRSGHEQILDGFEALWSSDAEITWVILGKYGSSDYRLADRLMHHPELGKRLFWIEEASQESRKYLLQKARGYISASCAEGTAQSVVDAARYGCEIICRDLAVFREELGAFGTYIEMSDTERVAAAILNVVEALGSSLFSRTVELPWRSWSDCAVELEAILFPNKITAAAAPSGAVIRDMVGFSAHRKGKTQRIVVVKLDHLGDLLLAVPALSQLKVLYPDAIIDGVIGSWCEPLARRLELFNRIYVFDYFKKKSAHAPSADCLSIAALVEDVGCCDIAIDFRRQSDTRKILVALNSRLHVGYQTGDIQIDRWLDVSLPQAADVQFELSPLNKVHASKQMLALVASLPEELCDFQSRTNLSWSKNPNSLRRVAIFPKAGNDIKEWSELRYLQLAQKLSEVSRVDEINIYLASSEDMPGAQPIANSKIRVHRGLSLHELVVSLQGNSLCIANNSFGAHLASSLGVQTLGVYGGHEAPDEWAPVFGNGSVIHRPVPCSPCHLPRASDCLLNLECLNISVEFVLHHAKSFLERLDTRHLCASTW